MSMMNTIGEFAKGYVMGYVATKAVKMLVNGARNRNFGRSEAVQQQPVCNAQGRNRYNDEQSSKSYYVRYDRCF